MNELNAPPPSTIANTSPGSFSDAMGCAMPLTGSESITVVVNGAPETATAPTLQAWVEALGVRGVLPTALATAVNGTFVLRSQRAQTALREGDTILTFQPIAGG